VSEDFSYLLHRRPRDNAMVVDKRATGMYTGKYS